ncbi:MAG: class I SAM-dependent methyltransferase [Deltaproteobacteria bacterium]|nr:class I SAM-dependent methyltransferase [Deltaproteobacteria bacterium]
MIVRRIHASDHREAYDLWAKHFADPALMANRDAETTRRKLARVASQLSLGPASRVLDVGPGDGALFRLVSNRVLRCCGVDPSASAVAKLTRLFRNAPNVEFRLGSAEDIPYADKSFDVVVINSVLQALPSKAVVEQALAELVRVCSPGGTVFVGELPFRPELDRGIVVHLGRKLREFGPRALARTIYSTYIRPLLRGEPLVLYPATNLHVPQEEFEAICSSLGLAVRCLRHLELRRPSETRNDYFLALSS